MNDFPAEKMSSLDDLAAAEVERLAGAALWLSGPGSPAALRAEHAAAVARGDLACAAWLRRTLGLTATYLRSLVRDRK